MNYQDSGIFSPLRKVLGLLHCAVFCYALAMIAVSIDFSGEGPALLPLPANMEFWLGVLLALPLLAASGISWIALSFERLQGSALCLCFFVFLCGLALGFFQTPLYLVIGTVLLYGASSLLFFRSLWEKWTEQTAFNKILSRRPQ